MEYKIGNSKFSSRESLEFYINAKVVEWDNKIMNSEQKEWDEFRFILNMHPLYNTFRCERDFWISNGKITAQTLKLELPHINVNWLKYCDKLDLMLSYVSPINFIGLEHCTQCKEKSTSFISLNPTVETLTRKFMSERTHFYMEQWTDFHNTNIIYYGFCKKHFTNALITSYSWVGFYEPKVYINVSV